MRDNARAAARDAAKSVRVRRVDVDITCAGARRALQTIETLGERAGEAAEGLGSVHRDDHGQGERSERSAQPLFGDRAAVVQSQLDHIGPACIASSLGHERVEVRRAMGDDERHSVMLRVRVRAPAVCARALSYLSGCIRHCANDRQRVLAVGLNLCNRVSCGYADQKRKRLASIPLQAIAYLIQD